MWTVLDYAYRNARNFKAFGSVAFKGKISPTDELRFQQRLEAGEFFIAEQIGVPPLYEKLYEFSGGPTEDDHCWHEFLDFRHMEALDQTLIELGSSDGFIARCAAITRWNESLSPHFELTLAS